MITELEFFYILWNATPVLLVVALLLYLNERKKKRKDEQ